MKLLSNSETHDCFEKGQSVYHLSMKKALEAQAKLTASEIFEKVEKLREACCIGKETTLCLLATPGCSFLSRSCRLYQNLKKKYGCLKFKGVV